MQIFYGTLDDQINVTAHVPLNSDTNEMLIPAGDEERTNLFGDPVFGSEKFIFIRSNGRERVVSRNEEVVINNIDDVFSQSDKKVYYGSVEKRIDVTKRVELLFNSDVNRIPSNPDERAEIFGDPHFGVEKNVFFGADAEYRVFYGSVEAGKVIDVTDKLTGNVFDFPSSDEARVKLFTDPCYGFEKAIFIPHLDAVLTVGESAIYDVRGGKLRESALLKIHQQLKFSCGSLMEELTEQIMSIKYIKPTDFVLELGGNIGRNSCVIASILNDSSNLTVLEPDLFCYMILNRNRNVNKFLFRTINAALSKKPLYLTGVGTAQSTSSFETERKINVVDITELSWNFTTLVADCEGALKQILEDYPNFFDTFRTILLENDYATIEDYQFVRRALEKSKFSCVEVQSISLQRPCMKNFYEAWVKQ